MFFVGKIADHSLVYTSGTYSAEPDSATILQVAVDRFGGVTGDYTIFRIVDTSANALRVLNGDAFDITWTGNAITGLTFTSEDVKRWVRVILSKAELLADNADTATLTAEVWKADKSGIDTGISASVTVPITVNSGIVYIKFTVVNGTGTKTIKVMPQQVGLMGIWTIPAAVARFNNVRVYNQVQLTVLLAL